MLPLIYVGLTAALFLTSAVTTVLVFLGWMPHVVLPFLTIALVVLLFLSLLRSIRFTYGDRVAQVIISGTGIVLSIGTMTYNPWNALFALVWTLAFILGLKALRGTQKLLALTRKQAWNPDTLSMSV